MELGQQHALRSVTYGDIKGPGPTMLQKAEFTN
jgi:hypothetical protein